MHRKAQKYIALDFETTGLSHTHDEPIQIGIICFDEKGKIFDSFSSYLQPAKSIDTFTKRLTGITTEQLKNAPLPTAIVPLITSVIDENSIFVGHNVDFDIKFLQQFYPLESFHQIDTYYLARNILHHMPSYSLETLSEKLGLILNEKNHHDALADCHTSIKLFMFLLNRLDSLVVEFPVLKNCFIKNTNNESIYNLIYRYDTILNPNDSLSMEMIPKRKKHATLSANKQPLKKSDLQLVPQQKYFIGYNNFEKLLVNLISIPNQQCIFSFSSFQKAIIAKKILSKHGIIVNQGFHSTDLFSTEKRHRALSKTSLREEEVNTFLSYCSHISDNAYDFDSLGGMQDVILAYVTNEKRSIETPLTICTHDELLEAVHGDIVDHSSDIYFFDRDRRYSTYSKFMTKPVTFNTLFLSFEKFLYRMAQDQSQDFSDISALYGRLLIISSEIVKLTDNIIGKSNKIDIDGAMFAHSKAHFTHFLRERWYKNIKNRQDKLPLDLNENIDYFASIFYKDIRIEKKSTNEGNTFYTYRSRNVLIDYQGFRDMFVNHNIRFLTNTDRKATIVSEMYSQETKSELLIMSDQSATVASIASQYGLIYVISNKKSTSQSLINSLYIHCPDISIYGENITGGHGKIRHQLKHNGTGEGIVVGGLGLLLQLYANGIRPKKIIIYSLSGNLVPVILRDILYYYPR